MGEKFNVQGSSGRDCPLCYRVGTLTGARDGDAPRLTCSGCLTVFRLEWSTDKALAPDTLTRITGRAAAAPYFTLEARR
jgi:hypothetical protein